MTASLSHILATMPRLWVIKISASPCSFCRSRKRFRYCAWIVRSRLVVGSSAMSSRGSQEMPIAPTMRWRMPPDISCEPRLLIADEPTTSLDLTIQAQYLNLLRELQREHGLALIFITHNLGIVAKMCDQLAVMYAGRVVEQGPVSRIFNAPAHPYTKALLGSIPRMTDNREHLTAIEGQPPDLASLPPGCSFAPRCPAAFARCHVEEPPEIALGEGCTARCWLAAPGADTSRADSGAAPIRSTVA